MADYEVKGKMTLDSGSFISSATAASNSLNGLNNSANASGNAMKWLKRGAMAAATAMAGMAAAGVKAASDYQQANIAFTTMLGSAEKATAFLNELRDFAAATPFELPDLLQGSRRLMAMGFAAEDVLPMLTAVGDAASGLGVGAEGINRITLALGQMKAKGKVSGEEMRQLAEAGIPAWKYLAEASGKTTAEVMKLGENGAIPADQAIQVLIAGMENGIGTVRGFGGMMEQQSKTMSGLLSTLKDTARNAFVDGFNKYVPAISGVFATLIPSIGGVVQGLVAAMAFIITNIGKLASAFAKMLAPVITGLVIPAFKILVGILAVAIGVLGAIGGFMNEHIAIFQALAGVVAVVAVAYGGLVAGALLHNAVMKAQVAWTKLVTLWQARQAIATNVLSKAQRLLNLTMALNPIGLIVAAVALLIAGFVMLWNHSDGFRKIMVTIGKVGIKAIAFIIEMFGKLAVGIIKIATGPMKLLLKGLSMLGIDAAGKALNGIESMTDSVGEFFDGVAAKVEGAGAALDKFATKKVETPKTKDKPKPKGKGTTPTLDFGNGNAEDAKKALEDAKKTRDEAQKALQEMFATPFGQPSELRKALSDSGATVDSIIGQYDKIVQNIDARFTGLDQGKKSKLISFITDETAQLVKLAKAREVAVKALEDAQAKLDDVIQKQKDFQSNITSTVKTFGLALADITKADGEAIVQVIKTATGLMISQMKSGSSGVDVITKQLKDRLKQIQDFTANIKNLLSRGTNKAYVEQLLAAGPEAAGATAALLANASDAQLGEINTLYSDITTASEAFGTDMASAFYDNSVKMAQGIVDGAKFKVDAINSQMALITSGIETALKPLANSGTTNGDALMQGMSDAIAAKRTALINQAKEVAAAVAAALAGANPSTKPVTTKPVVPTSPSPTPLPSTFKPYLTTPAVTPGNASGFIGPVLPNAAPTVTVTINKNIEDSEVEGIMTRAMLNAMRAR